MTRTSERWATLFAVTLVIAAPAIASAACADDPADERSGAREKPIPWSTAHVAQDDRTLRITYTSTPPRLTKIVVRERQTRVAVTAFQLQPEEAVPQVGLHRCFRIRLQRPLGSRRLIDGAARRRRRVRHDRYGPEDGPPCRRVRVVRR